MWKTIEARRFRVGVSVCVSLTIAFVGQLWWLSKTRLTIHNQSDISISDIQIESWAFRKTIPKLKPGESRSFLVDYEMEHALKVTRFVCASSIECDDSQFDYLKTTFGVQITIHLACDKCMPE